MHPFTHDASIKQRNNTDLKILFSKFSQSGILDLSSDLEKSDCKRQVLR